MKRDYNRMQKEALDNRIRMKMNEGNRTLYSEKERKRFSMTDQGKRCMMLCIFMVAALILSILLVADVTEQNYSIAFTAKYAITRMRDLVDLLSGNKPESQIHYFMFQFFSAVLAGVALSVAGVCFQGVFQNPMASPTMLGVQSGGTLGGTVYVMFFYTPMLSTILAAGSANAYELYAAEYHSMSLFQKFGQYFFTLGGCIVVVFIVMLMAKIAGRGRISTVPLMVGGTIFSSCVANIVNLLQYYLSATGANDTITETVQSLQSGTFEPIWVPFLLISFMITALVPLIFAMAGTNKLNVLTFGEEEARAMGISVRNTRVYYVIVSTLLTASVIAFVGNINFVGLIVPHFARMVVGNDFKYLVPASAFMGGIFMLLAWDVSYMIGFAVNTGMIVSMAGSAIFMVFMIRYRRQGHADWA